MITRPTQTNLFTFLLMLIVLTSGPVVIIIFLTRNFWHAQEHFARAQHHFIEQKPIPLLHIIDGVLHEVEPNNRYELNIQAKHTDIMRSSSRIICSHINGVIFDKERKEIHFTSPQGIIAQDEKTLHFPLDIRGTFNDGMFEGHNITYHLDKHELSSDQIFSFNHPIISFQSTSGTMNFKNSQGFLKGEVSTTIIPHGKQPQR